MNHPIDKSHVIEALEEMAVLLEMKDANIFKIRAFQNAARSLESEPSDLEALITTGKLEELKGIGKGISEMIRELWEKGKSADHQRLRKEFPESLFELFRIQGIGPKRIKVLYEKLKIKSVQGLEAAARAGKLAKLDGFGDKSQEKILQGIQLVKRSAGQFRLDFAREEAEKLAAYLRSLGSDPKRGQTPLKIQIAGSIRRSKEVVRDIDILVTAKNPAAVHKAFVEYPDAAAVQAHGETKSSITLKNGMDADLRTVTEKEFPFALHYFTGSKEHNVAVRTLAKKKNFKINEYGLFKGNRSVPCRDEEELYKKLGLHYIPPEARENTGEIEWAGEKEFPDFVETKDIRGVFHVHSTYSDGRAPLEQMIEEAERLGYDYVGISDHSQSAGYANGLKPERLREQWKEIEKLQKRFKIRIFRGIESDILGDGSLDYPDAILREFDFVIGSVHSLFQMAEEEMTRRIFRAMDNPYTTFLGHPTGRLLLAREGYAVNLHKVIEHAGKTGVVVELNANPNRLDLDWRHCRTAKDLGVPLGIHPDAHAVKGLSDVRYGVGIARKAWLEKKDVLNTLPLAEMEKFLRRRK